MSGSCCILVLSSYTKDIFSPFKSIYVLWVGEKVLLFAIIYVECKY